MPLTRFINIFGQSPIKPLQTHMAKVILCAQGLLPFFQAVIHQDWQEAERVHQLIVDGEHEADRIKKDLRLHLPKSLFLPVSRSDILAILSKQDKIANKAKDIAGMVIGRRMHFPDLITQDFLSFVRRCLDAALQAQHAINELDELLEVGFRGKEVQLVEKMIEELDKIENDTDSLQIQIRKKIFSIEEQLPPINAIFLYKIIEWTGDLADDAHRVGGQLQLLLAR